MTQGGILINISLITHHYWNSADLIEPVEEISFANQISLVDDYYSKKAICIFMHA